MRSTLNYCISVMKTYRFLSFPLEYVIFASSVTY
uniref:Uncharacterized protein n=1 Tax=Anguilla anguilla TaxID=7936 RepID=A0A0E9PFP8_ANGAN